MRTAARMMSTTLDSDGGRHLRVLLRRRATSDERQAALTSIVSLDREALEALLDTYLAAVRTAGRLAQLKWLKWVPVSWGGRDLAALDRVLRSEPGSPEDESSTRRVLLSTLKQLPRAGGVLRLEQEVRRRSRAAASFEEMLERTPDIGTPSFEVVEEARGYQIRRYDDFSVAQTVRHRKVAPDGVKLGEPTMSGAGAFQALAGYIFGGNSRQEKMSMTTPVFTRGDAMEFVLPSAYWTSTDGAPEPLSDTVSLESGEAGLVAAHFYGGYSTADQVDRRKAELLESLRDSDWVPRTGALPFSAAYNDPFTPPWRRRNEVLVAVEPKPDSESFSES